MLTPFRRFLKRFHPETIPRLGIPFYNAFSQKEFFQRHYDLVARDILACCPAGRILDIGAGPGWLLIKLHHLSPAVRLVGVDISPGMAVQAKQNLADLGLAGVIEVGAGGSSQLPFAAASFDAVVSTVSLHHWRDPLAGLNEAWRVLKPGGYALMYDVVRDTPAAILKQAGREFGPLSLATVWLLACVEPFYSPRDLVSLAGQSLFQEGTTKFVGVLGALILKKSGNRKTPQPVG